jgi:hypothetical protein
MRSTFAMIGLALGSAGAGGSLPAQGTPSPTRSSDYLYLWTASADSTQPDFLAVVDMRASSGTYGKLVTTVPVPGRKNGPHHTEHQVVGDGTLFANGFDSGQSFVFDLSKPAAPRVARSFGDVQGMMHPHSFLRMPNGNVLATFQMRHVGAKMLPGGLAELTTTGAVVRTANANGPGVDPRVRPYSAAIMPAIDRLFTTTTDMDGTDEINDVQLWRLSDFALLKTFTLPNGPRGNEGALTAEPRLLPDGKSLLVSTFNCGLYLVTGLDTPSPSATLVSSFPQKPKTSCAIPVIAGNFYLVTVPAWSAVVSLDISNPAKPREVSRLTLGKDEVPHWISMEPNQQRLVVTGYAGLQHRVVVAQFNAQTGALSLDTRFREAGAAAPGFYMDNKTWPHGGKAKGVPHGAVFSR